MEKISPTTILKRDPDQIFSTVDGEVIMLSLNEGKYFVLNEVGSRIWSLIEKPIPVNYVIEKLTMEFDVSSAICEKETIELLYELHKQGLLIFCY